MCLEVLDLLVLVPDLVLYMKRGYRLAGFDEILQFARGMHREFVYGLRQLVKRRLVDIVHLVSPWKQPCQNYIGGRCLDTGPEYVGEFRV